MTHAEMHMERVLSSLSDLEALATSISPHLRGGMQIGLCGDLAAGKTTLTRFIAHACGTRVPVSSPTFVLCHEYPSEHGITLEHWDLYRLREAPDELLLPPAQSVIRIVEWANKDADYLERFDAIFTLTIPDLSPGDSESSARHLSITVRDAVLREAIRQSLAATPHE